VQLYPHLDSLWFVRADMYAEEEDWKDYDALLANTAGWPAGLTEKDVAFYRLMEGAVRTPTQAKLAAARKAILANGRLRLQDQVSDLARLGFVDDAFTLTDRYAQGVITVYNNPSFLFAPPTANLRRDPRFMGLAARLGLVTYWRSTSNWPDFCSEPGLPYACKAEAAKLAGKRS